jgi:glycosyltransferase involved in cell wall biosynthesis
MRVLVLEPWDGGSHRAFLDGWIAGSNHRFTRLGLPPRRWKWRMRHSALTFAEEVAVRQRRGEEWDVVFCSDMLDLAAFRGLTSPDVGHLPTVIYFHENQLTYPVREEAERDLHFAFTNLTSALAADAVWWNSAFHRDEYLEALSLMAARMPDHKPREAPRIIRQKSRVEPPGVALFPQEQRRSPRPPGDLHIAWVARWEFDKDPDTFFAALVQLQHRGVPFRLSVFGEQFQQVPEVFARVREELAEHIEHWGFVECRGDYLAMLAQVDVVVSTAQHEFFGMAVVEAITAGCYPLLPSRLAYPELLRALAPDQYRRHFFDGSESQLVECLTHLAALASVGELWEGEKAACALAVERFSWARRAPALDAALEAMIVHAMP